MMKVVSIGAVLVAMLAATALAQTEGKVDTVHPEGMKMLLPRNAIPSIFAPKFVAAIDAEIPDDAWVLGVAIDGEARAYDLNLLNHHEIVNDVIAGKPIASVW